MTNLAVALRDRTHGEGALTSAQLTHAALIHMPKETPPKQFVLILPQVCLIAILFSAKNTCPFRLPMGIFYTIG
jgi:hypothetical protein